jgi:hypothetical protein
MIRELVFGLPIRAVARVPLLLAFLGTFAAWPAVAQDARASASSGMNMVDITPASMFSWTCHRGHPRMRRAGRCR